MIILIRIVSLNLLNDLIINLVWKTLLKDIFVTVIFVKKAKYYVIKLTII